MTNYLTIQEAARIMRKSPVGLQCDISRSPQKLPPFVKLGNRILFDEEKLYKFIESKTVNPENNELLSKSSQIGGKKRGRPSSVTKSGV